MFYNSTLIYQTLFVFTVSKMSYNIIYRTNDSSSKIVTIMMCVFGSCNIWSRLSQFKFKIKDVQENDDIPLISNESSDEEKIDDYTKRTDISDVINDVDRLLDNSAQLGENIEV